MSIDYMIYPYFHLLKFTTSTGKNRQVESGYILGKSSGNFYSFYGYSTDTTRILSF